MRRHLLPEVGRKKSNKIQIDSMILCTHDDIPSSHQVNILDPHKAVEVLLKVGSLYSEEAVAKTTVLETFGKVVL